MNNIFNKNKKISLQFLSSETSAMNNLKKKEDSRRSSDKLSFSDNFSVNNSTKGIKNYNFNKTKNIFLSDIDFTEKKKKENLKNKLINQTRYLSIFNSNKKQNSLKKSDYFPDSKLNNIFNITKKTLKSKTTAKKDHKNKYNISILEKFNKDFKKYFINSLENSKNEFQKKIAKINKTFYNSQIKKNINSDNNSLISEQSQKSFSSNENFKIKENNNNLEDKILKTKYSSQLIKYNRNYKRKRNFKRYIDEKKFLDKEWNTKIGIIKSNVEYNNLLLNDIKFQSRVIKDELCILSDDIQYYRLTFFGNNDFFSSFKNMPIQKQVKVNKILEESCALLHFIPKIILKEYYYSTDKFIAIDDPSKEMFSKKVVYNELEIFQENLKYLYKISNFVKCCGEVYSQLIIQVGEEMAISSQNFFILREILKRIRFFIIEMTNICKNILTNYCFDKYVIINNFKRVIKQTKLDDKRLNTESQIRNIRLKKKPKLKQISALIISKDKPKIKFKEKDNNKNNDLKDFDINKEKINNISKTFGKNSNFVWDKMTRIKKALELNNVYDKIDVKNKKEKILEKNEIKPMACINSKLMSKMLKYINKDIREKIISIRTTERHLNYHVEE